MFHAFSGQLEKLASSGDSLPDQPLVGALAGHLLEPSLEGANGESEPPGDDLNGEVFIEVSDHPVEDGAEWLVVGDSRGGRDVLGLRSVSVDWRDHSFGHFIGDGQAKVFANQGEGKVEPCGATGRGPQGPRWRGVVKVERVGLDLEPGEGLFQQAFVQPMGGYLPAIQEAGVSQGKDSATDRDQPSAPLGGASQGLEKSIRGALLGIPPSTDQDGVCRFEIVEATRWLDVESMTGRQAARLHAAG